MMEKQQKILDMAKDICRVKLNCNDVCNPISACDALKYAERAYEAGYRKQEWIGVDERLPEDDTTVLAYGGDIYYLTFDVFPNGGRWWTEDHGWFTTDELGITHWMPLPEPPKMKGGETDA